MSEFTPEILNEVLTACRAGIGEAAEALSRAFDQKITLEMGEPSTLKPDALPDEFNGPGLALVFHLGTSGAVLVVPESSALVPEWCAAPDATGQSKLATLAQELGMTLLPDSLMPEDSKTARVKNITGALLRGGMAEEAKSISLLLSTSEGKQGTARFIWPLSKPAAAIGAAAKLEPASVAPKSTPAVKPFVKPVSTPAKVNRDLSPYTKSLLRIKVPVVVTLAEKKQSLSRILEMGPGMIIQFDKSCEEMLELEVGEHKVAAGEAIKVGDKFGLRITSITLPEERFKPMKSRR